MSSGPNTRFRVELTARATRDLESIFAYINAATSTPAHLWFNALEDLIASLNHLPERGSITAENSELRQLLHGTKPHIYRVIYSIDLNFHRVRVLHIRHGARKPLKRTELM